MGTKKKFVSLAPLANPVLYPTLKSLGAARETANAILFVEAR